jgi:hypothetical protein
MFHHTLLPQPFHPLIPTHHPLVEVGRGDQSQYSWLRGFILRVCPLSFFPPDLHSSAAHRGAVACQHRSLDLPYFDLSRTPCLVTDSSGGFNYDGSCKCSGCVRQFVCPGRKLCVFAVLFQRFGLSCERPLTLFQSYPVR